MSILDMMIQTLARFQAMKALSSQPQNFQSITLIYEK